MTFEKKLIIGITILSRLIDCYDSGDSAVAVNDVIRNIKNSYGFEPTLSEVEEMVDLINKSSSRNDVLSKVANTMGYGLPIPTIITERKEDYLRAIKNQLEDELDKLTNIY